MASIRAALSLDDDDDEEIRPDTAVVSTVHPGQRTAGVSPVRSARVRSASPPWIPPGHRVDAGSENAGTAAQQKRVMASSRRTGRSVEHTHIFLDDPATPPTRMGNFFWAYASYEYKLQTPGDVARQVVFKMIEKLVDRAFRASGFDQAPKADPVASVSVTDKGAAARTIDRPVAVRLHLIFDIISTKKHITPDYRNGPPYLLGQEIYRFIDRNYSPWVVTTFVGLTDNTARRVGRDVYYTKTDDLSKTHVPFDAIDSEHLYIVFPPPGTVEPAAVPAKASVARQAPRQARSPPSHRRRRSSASPGSLRVDSARSGSSRIR